MKNNDDMLELADRIIFVCEEYIKDNESKEKLVFDLNEILEDE